MSDAPAPPGAAHLLLLEDDPLQSAVAADILRRAGLAVTTCGSTTELLGHCRRELYDLAVLSCGPWPDSERRLRLAAQLRQSHLLPSLLLSGTPLPHLRASPHYFYAQQLLPKPYTARQLRRAVHGAPGGAVDPFY